MQDIIDLCHSVLEMPIAIAMIRQCKVNNLFLVPALVCFCRPVSTFNIEKYNNSSNYRPPKASNRSWISQLWLGVRSWNKLATVDSSMKILSTEALTMQINRADSPLGPFLLVLKALCHAISTDCLLIEAARPHAVNEHWVWCMVDMFACTFKSALLRLTLLGSWLSRHLVGSRSYTYQYSYFLALPNRRLQASQLDHCERLMLHVFDLRVLLWTIPWYWVCPYFLCPL